jgi:hypothetical protein
MECMHHAPFRVEVLSSRMGPDHASGRLGHRVLPGREQDDGWRGVIEPILSPTSPCLAAEVEAAG